MLFWRLLGEKNCQKCEKFSVESTRRGKKPEGKDLLGWVPGRGFFKTGGVRPLTCSRRRAPLHRNPTFYTLLEGLPTLNSVKRRNRRPETVEKIKIPRHTLLIPDLVGTSYRRCWNLQPELIFLHIFRIFFGNCVFFWPSPVGLELF